MRLFLHSYETRGAFGQLPSLGARFQPLENRALRRKLSIDEDGRDGMLVVSVAPLMPAAKLLAVGDVVFQLDGCPLAEDGTVEAMPGLRLPWEYLVTRRAVGESIEVEVLRNGSRFTASVPLVPDLRLVAFHDGVRAHTPGGTEWVVCPVSHCAMHTGAPCILMRHAY